MELLWLHSPHAMQAAVALELDAGSFDEPHEYPGLAHFLEHMVFRGSRSFAADDGLMALAQRSGGQVNASTRGTRTLFHFQVDEEHLGEAMARLVDQLCQPLLDPQAQLAEREVIEAEFRLRGSDPDTLVDAALGLCLNPLHPASGFHAGNRDSLPVESAAFQHALQAYRQCVYDGAAVRVVVVSRQAPHATPLNTLSGGRRDWHDDVPASLALDHSADLHLSLEGGRPRQVLAVALESAGRGAARLVELLNDALPAFSAQLQLAGLAQEVRSRLVHGQADQALLVFTFSEVEPVWRGALGPLLLAWLQTQGSLETGHRRALAARWPSLSSLDKAHCLLERAKAGDHEVAQAALIAALQARRCVQVTQDSRPVASRRQAGFELALEQEVVPACAYSPLPAATIESFISHESTRAAWAGALHAPLWDEPLIAALLLFWPDAGQVDPAFCSALQRQAWRCGVRLQLRPRGVGLELELVGHKDFLAGVLAETLDRLSLPAVECAQAAAPAGEGIVLRQLLDALPRYLQGDCAVRWLGLPRLSSGLLLSHDEHLASCIAGVCQARGMVVRAALPATARHRGGEQCLHVVPSSGAAHALVAFWPEPSDAIGRVAWRLLGQSLAAPFQRRLRDEQHLGYALYCGYRVISGQGGLLCAIQSDQVDVPGLWQSITVFFQEQDRAIAGWSDADWQAQLAPVRRKLSTPGSLQEAVDLASMAWSMGEGTGVLRVALGELDPASLAGYLAQRVDGPRTVLATAPL
ncbi:insulinase family protein [Pseudomonas sp. LRF_L74]|uniref:insulinase family protein n=1 Tax=Pseudomonas sp. LRF_L74 TaxID=3369422 RepID=UPI003F645B90